MVTDAQVEQVLVQTGIHAARRDAVEHPLDGHGDGPEP
jgi:hypothetical protein